MILEGFFLLLSNIFLFSSRIDNVNSFPNPLSAEKEREYLIKYRENGDTEAKNILIKHNLRLVVFIAKKYVNYPDNEELISIGTIGLMKAISTFNPDKGSALATYASRCIENEILMAMRSYKKRAQDMSIYDSAGCDKEGNDLPIVDLLQTDEENVYAKLEDEFLQKTLNKMIKSFLNDREAEIIKKRFGLCGSEQKTQQIVAEEMGLSRSYISRIEKKSLAKLRKAIYDSDLEL